MFRTDYISAGIPREEGGGGRVRGNLEVSADEEEVDFLCFFLLETGEGGVDCVEFAVTAAFDGDFHGWFAGTARAVGGESARVGDEGEEFAHANTE